MESEPAMKLVIGSDHAGFQLKEATGDLLRSLGHEVLDVGAFNENPSDYPDFAEAVGRAVLEGKAERGVLICGSGVGASVAANKPMVRPAAVSVSPWRSTRATIFARVAPRAERTPISRVRSATIPETTP